MANGFKSLRIKLRQPNWLGLDIVKIRRRSDLFELINQDAAGSRLITQGGCCVFFFFVTARGWTLKWIVGFHSRGDRIIARASPGFCTSRPVAGQLLEKISRGHAPRLPSGGC